MVHFGTFTGKVVGKDDTFVEIRCYDAGYEGELTKQPPIEEFVWLTSADAEQTTPTGGLILAELKLRDLID